MPGKAGCHLFCSSKWSLDISIILPITSALRQAARNFWSPENPGDAMAGELVIMCFPHAVKWDEWDSLAQRQPAENQCDLLGARPWPESSTVWGGKSHVGGRISLHRPWRDPKCDIQLWASCPWTYVWALLYEVGGEGGGVGTLVPPNCDEGLADP